MNTFFVKNFFSCHARLITFIVALILSLLFIGNIFFAVFCGGEFVVEAETNAAPKGIMRLNAANYSKVYFEGDAFDFDKESSNIGLFVKDPAIDDLIKINDLPASEYGFKANGGGDIIDDPLQIVMTPDITHIDLVSKAYPSVFASLDVMVYSAPDQSILSSDYTSEAEDADLYKDNKLLSYEEKSSLPNTDKPFLSSEGSMVDGLSCSGGACLRNFTDSNMRVEFNIVSMQETDAYLDIKICLRKESKSFDQYYAFSLNGEEYQEVNSQIIPKGTNFFTPYTLGSVTVKLLRGLNVFTFVSGSAIGKISPVNLDAIQVRTQDAVMCSLYDISGEQKS